VNFSSLILQKRRLIKGSFCLEFITLLLDNSLKKNHIENLSKTSDYLPTGKIIVFLFFVMKLMTMILPVVNLKWLF